MLTSLRRMLNTKVSVEAMTEVAMWLLIPYIVIGLAWTFTHPGQVQERQEQLQTRLPAGSDLVAFGEITMLWPVLLLAPDVCQNING